MMAWFGVAIGGAIGTIIRYGLLKICPTSWGSIPTLLSNIVACFILGYCMQKSSLVQHTNIMLLLTTGLCGGMSTFSTLIYELYQYYVNGTLYLGIFYLFITIVLGISSLAIGIKLV
jgi:CrcB protein